MIPYQTLSMPRCISTGTRMGVVIRMMEMELQHEAEQEQHDHDSRDEGVR